MAERPYTVLSCAVSMDGYLDDASPDRLVLSNPDDLDRVDAVRASCDAILVGAGTVRADDPRLAVRSAARRVARSRRGRPATPLRVTLTRGGDLDAGARMFAAAAGDDESRPLVYCPRRSRADVGVRLRGRAEVVPLGDDRLDLGAVTADLAGRGVRRLLVEGGGSVLTQFLALDLADELHLAVAPLFVGDATARRFVGDGPFPWRPGHRARLTQVARVGDVALLRYALSARWRAD